MVLVGVLLVLTQFCMNLKSSRVSSQFEESCLVLPSIESSALVWPRTVPAKAKMFCICIVPWKENVGVKILFRVTFFTGPPTRLKSEWRRKNLRALAAKAVLPLTKYFLENLRKTYDERGNDKWKTYKLWQVYPSRCIFQRTLWKKCWKSRTSSDLAMKIVDYRITFLRHNQPSASAILKILYSRL